jgi:hypothetical protein
MISYFVHSSSIAVRPRRKGEEQMNGIRSAVILLIAVLTPLVPGSGSSAADPLFDPPVVIGLGGPSPWVMDSGDFNDDGYPDLVVGHYSGYGLTILLNDGQGFFTMGETYPLEGSPRWISVGELQGDGHLDIVCIASQSSHPGHELLAFRGNGRGQFAMDWFSSDSSGPYFCALGCSGLDGDSDLDLAVAEPSGQLKVYSNDGNGSFSTVHAIPSAGSPFAVRFADLTGDGMNELVACEHNPDQATILVFGEGSYKPTGSYPVEHGSYDVRVADLDNDGDLDLVFPQYDIGIKILENLGNGLYGKTMSLDFPCGVYLTICDIDLDGNQDLVTIDRDHYPVKVQILHGNGDLTFAPQYWIDVGSQPILVVSDDFDLDHDFDLAVIRYTVSEISIVLNNTLFPQWIVAGPGPEPDNPPLVRVFPPRQNAGPAGEFLAYGSFSSGVNVACGVLPGSDAGVIIVGPGPGETNAPFVRGFHADGTLLEGLDFLAYATGGWGVNVAAGDLDGDGADEIITGAGPGPVCGPHVRGWSYDGSSTVTALAHVSFLAYGTPKWGINVASGDIDGDGCDEIVTGPGPGAVYGPHVRGWNVDGSPASAMPGVSFMAYGTAKFGVQVGCGDVDGDGIEEIVTGAGPGPDFGAHVRGWKFDGESCRPLPGLSFLAWPPEQFRYGVKIFAGADLDGDFRADLLLSPGPDSAAGTPIKVYGYTGSTVVNLFSLDGFRGLTRGTTLAAGYLR